MQTFLRPLSREEETRCLELLKSGKPWEQKAAKDVLVEHNLRLVAHIARKYQNAGEELEDLISTGIIGLMKAIESFESERGKLSTYAARCIENELLMLFRVRKKNAKDVSLYEPIGTDKEGNEINLLEVTVQEQTDLVELIEQNDQIRKLPELLACCLSDREREIIMMRYGLCGREEVTQKMIGVKLGISRSYVSRIEKRALHKLRLRLEQ